MKYCLNCQQLVNPRKKFNTIVFILLLCCTFFGGILYLIYYAAKSKNCPMCNSTNWGVKPPEPQYQFPIPQVQPIAEGFKLCVQCGEKIGNTVQFCVFCGAEQN